MPSSSTLFLTSSLLRDHDPSAVSSAGKRTEVSKIEFYAPQGFYRDKVRSQDRNYMAAGCARYPFADSTGIVLCAQGTRSDPAGLVYVDTKRPHKSHMLLNNFQGRPFNSPCDIVANFIDNCLYFTDPAYGFERSYRPKPQLPTGHIYRFDPLSGDCRVVANGLARPGGLAFSPDFTVMYVSDLGDKYGGTTLYAYDMIYNAWSPRRPGPLAHSISSISNGRSGTPNSHQKNTSLSSTESSGDSSQHHYRASPAASAQALAAAARYAAQSSTSSTTNGQQAPNLSRSNSGASRPLKFMSSINLKSSFNITPSLSQQQQHQHQHQHVQEPRPLSPPLTASSSGHSVSAAVTDGAGICGAFLAGKRLFAYSPSLAPSGGIATDPLQGNVWLGTDEGVEIFSGCAGSLVGKVLVPEDESVSPVEKYREGKRMTGVSRVAFGNHGEAWLLGGERLWRIGFGGTTGPGGEVM